MGLSDSYGFYIIIFHVLSAVLCSIEENAGPVYKLRMKKPDPRAVQSANYGNTSRGSGIEEGNYDQSNPPQLIAAVEYQIMRELQRMVISNVNGSDDAAAALSEIESYVKEGMPLTDALREGLRTMFPDVLGQQDSTSDEGTMVALILFTNAKKYMQDVYILNSLQQQTKECENSNESHNSSTNKNSNVAGNRLLVKSRSSKSDMIDEISQNDVNERVTAEKSGINSSVSQTNNSRPSGALRLPKGTPKIKTDETQSNVLTPPNTTQIQTDFSKNTIARQQKTVSPQPVISKLPDTSKSRFRQVQTASNSSTRQLAQNNVAKNQRELQQSKLSQNGVGQNTLRNYKSEPSSVSQPLEEKNSQILADSKIKSDLDSLSNVMSKWLTKVQGSQHQNKITSDNDISIKTAIREKQTSDSDLKKEQNIPVLGNVQPKKSPVQKRSKISTQGQQVMHSSTSASGTPAEQPSKSSRKGIGKENFASLSDSVNEEIINVPVPLQQYQATNDGSSSKKVIQEEKQDLPDFESEEELLELDDDDEREDTEELFSSSMKMSNQNQQTENSNNFSPKPSTQKINVPGKSQFLKNDTAKENSIRKDQQNQKMSQVRQVETKPSQDQSLAKEKIKPTIVQRSPSINSSSMNITETKRPLRNGVPIITEEPTSGMVRSKSPQTGIKKSEVLQKKPGQLPIQDEVNVDQKQDLKQVVHRLNKMNQSGRVEDSSSDHLDRNKLVNQRGSMRQMEKSKYEDLVEDENIHLEETQPVESEGSEVMEGKIFIPEIPVGETYTFTLNKSKPVRETLQYRDNGYGRREEGEEKEYSGSSPSVHERRSIYEEKGYMESERDDEYEREREDKEYGITQGYEGIRKGTSQQWSQNGSTSGSNGKVLTSTSESRGIPSYSGLIVKPATTQVKSAARLSENERTMSATKTQQKGSENERTMSATRTQQKGCTKNGESAEKQIKSVSSPANQKWQRKVFKIVEESHPSGEVVRKISRKGNWSSFANSVGSKQLLPRQGKLSDTPSFNRQPVKNGIIEMDDAMNEMKESILINDTDEPWQIIKHSIRVK